MSQKVLTLSAPSPQNSQTQSDNSSATASVATATEVVKIMKNGCNNIHSADGWMDPKKSAGIHL